MISAFECCAINQRLFNILLMRSILLDRGPLFPTRLCEWPGYCLPIDSTVVSLVSFYFRVLFPFVFSTKLLSIDVDHGSVQVNSPTLTAAILSTSFPIAGRGPIGHGSV